MLISHVNEWSVQIPRCEMFKLGYGSAFLKNGQWQGWPHNLLIILPHHREIHLQEISPPVRYNRLKEQIKQKTQQWAIKVLKTPLLNMD